MATPYTIKVSLKLEDKGIGFRQGGEGLNENKQGREKPGAGEEEKEMWMINDASSNWMKKYGCCLICIAGETQRQRFTLQILTPRGGSALDSKATVLRGPLPQLSSPSSPLQQSNS